MWIWIGIQMQIWIRIGMKTMPIHNTGYGKTFQEDPLCIIINRYLVCVNGLLIWRAGKMFGVGVDGRKYKVYTLQCIPQ
jgi:hypothetical protein